MARVIVSKEARNDLVSIRDYIRDELCNPDAAQRILASLKKSILSLEHFPGRGKPLDTLIPVHTEYQHLLCENCCIFYLCRTALEHCSCPNKPHGFTSGHTSSIYRRRDFFLSRSA